MTDHERTFSFGMGLIATIAGLLAFTTSAAASDTVQINNLDTNLCLQPIGGSTARGVAIVQEPCAGSASQQWKMVSVGSVDAFGDGTYHFVNVLSGLCLDARGGAANHTPIQQWPCNSISNENWQYSDDDFNDEIPPLISRVSGTNSYCLDVPGDQRIIGLAVQIYRCNGTGAQAWFFNDSSS
jgi:hypothetical protein